MTPLSLWRDSALVLLAVEAFVAISGAGAVLYLGLTWLGQARAWINPRLPLVRHQARQFCAATGRATAATAAPFVTLQAAAIGLRRMLEVLAGGRT